MKWGYLTDDDKQQKPKLQFEDDFEFEDDFDLEDDLGFEDDFEDDFDDFDDGFEHEEDYADEIELVEPEPQYIPDEDSRADAKKLLDVKEESGEKDESDDEEPKKSKLALIITLASVGLVGVYTLLCVFASSFIDSVEIGKASVNLAPQTSDTLDADIGYSFPVIAFSESVEWESSNPDVVEVDENGVLNAIAEGDAVVTASVKSGAYKSECSVSVRCYGTVEFTSGNIELGEGESANLSWSGGGSVSFESDDESIVQVSDTGAVKAGKTGTAVVTVSSAGWKDGRCEIVVKEAPEKLIINEAFSMGVGEVYKISADVEEAASASTYTYSTSDAGVVSVDQSGNITAVYQGKAVVTVTAYNGVSADAEITVVPAPTKLTLEDESVNIYSGSKYVIKPQADTAAVAFKYTSSDEKIATVDEDGTVLGRGRGSATITCETYNGLTASFKVNVKIVNYTQKYTPQKINDDIGYLQQSFPELISTEVIGKSELGKDLTLVKLGKGERIALIVSGFHSNESTAVNFTMRCIEEYAAAYYSESGMYGNYNMKKLLEKFTLYIVPMVNPDGLEIVNCDVLPVWTNGVEPESVTFGVDWRDEYTANANGVNLNRNFPFRWDKIISSTEGPHINLYRGESEGSESETQALVKLCSEHEFEWMFSMHVRGYFIYWRDEFSKSVPGDYDLAIRLRDVCGFELLGPSKIKNLGGGFENWFRAEYNRPGFCIELIDPKYTKFVNENFERNVNWKKTKYTFIQGMMDK